MSLNGVAAASGVVFFIMESFIIVSAIKRSAFGWLLLLTEYFYLLGLGVYPILLGFGVIDAPEKFSNYLSNNDGFSVVTFFHIALYGAGALSGYYLARPFANKISRSIIKFSVINKVDNYMWFYCISGVSIFFSFLYFYFVGFETALMNASAARGGDFSGLEGFEQYSFLKRLAMVGMCSIIFVPYIIMDNRRIFTSFLIVFIVAVLIYFETVSRVIILDLIGVYLILYFSLKKYNWRVALFIVPVTAFLGFVFLYGKSFVPVVSQNLFLGESNVLTRHGDEELFSYFIAHFSHLFYSVDAGAKSFFLFGPIIPNDILLSPLAVVPSFVFSWVGLESLSYHSLENVDKLSCINTSNIILGSNKCTIPPYFPGAVAYFFPMAGALFFGFFRFLVYAIIETSWVKLRSMPELIWFPYFLFLVSAQLMLFIPSAISFAVFLILISWFLFVAKRVRM